MMQSVPGHAELRCGFAALVKVRRRLGWEGEVATSVWGPKPYEAGHKPYR